MRFTTEVFGTKLSCWFKTRLKVEIFFLKTFYAPNVRFYLVLGVGGGGKWDSLCVVFTLFIWIPPPPPITLEAIFILNISFLSRTVTFWYKWRFVFSAFDFVYGRIRKVIYAFNLFKRIKPTQSFPLTFKIRHVFEYGDFNDGVMRGVQSTF